MTGKLADTVMSVRNGEQIARKYQPIVFNPSTAAQVAQRAKLKLISQLSAAVANIIAFKREGSVSARNIFTKKNIGKATYANSEASFPMEQLDVTGGVLAISGNIAMTSSSTTINVWVPADCETVVYAIYDNKDDSLSLLREGVQADVTNGHASIVIDMEITSPVYVVAYGIRANDDNSKAIFGNLVAESATTNSVLNVVRNAAPGSITLTETLAIKGTPGNSRETVAKKK